MSIHSARGTAAHQVLAECLDMTLNVGIPTHPRDFLGTTIRVEPSTGHSSRSPSASDRWATCPGSVRMEETARGAGAVEEEETHDITLDEEDIIAATAAYDYVAGRVKDEGDHLIEVLLEHRVSPERYLLTEDCDGTVDVFLRGQNFFEIVDYKHGRGVYVPETTLQLQLYMLGVCAGFGNEAIPQRGKLTIIQPRFERAPAIRSAVIDDLPKWIAERSTFFRAACEATLGEHAPLVPSDKACMFCDASGICRPYQDFALRQAGILSDPLNTEQELYSKLEHFASTASLTLTGEEMVALLTAKEMLLGALKDVERSALQMIRHRSAPPLLMEMFKVVNGNAHRRWAQSEEDTAKRLKKIKIEDPEKEKLRAIGKKDLFELRLRSPAAMERFLKLHGIAPTDARWTALQRLIEQPEGALKLVPASEPGTPVDIGEPPPPPTNEEEAKPQP